MTKMEKVKQSCLVQDSDFELRNSFGFRNSPFVIRISFVIWSRLAGSLVIKQRSFVISHYVLALSPIHVLRRGVAR